MRLYSACSTRKLFCRILRTCTRSPHSCTWMMPLSSWLQSLSDTAVRLRQCFLCRYRRPTATAIPSAADRPSSRPSSDALCPGARSGLSPPLSGTPDGSLACLGGLTTSPNRLEVSFLRWVRETAPSVGSRDGEKSERARRRASGWRDAVKIPVLRVCTGGVYVCVCCVDVCVSALWVCSSRLGTVCVLVAVVVCVFVSV